MIDMFHFPRLWDDWLTCAYFGAGFVPCWSCWWLKSVTWTFGLRKTAHAETKLNGNESFPVPSHTVACGPGKDWQMERSRVWMPSATAVPQSLMDLDGETIAHHGTLYISACQHDMSLGRAAKCDSPKHFICSLQMTTFGWLGNT